RRTLRRHVQPAVMDGEDVVEDVLHRTMRRLAILDQLLAGQFREGFAVVAQDLPAVLVDGSEVRRRGHVVAYHRGSHKGFRGAARTRAFAARGPRPPTPRREPLCGRGGPAGTRTPRG